MNIDTDVLYNEYEWYKNVSFLWSFVQYLEWGDGDDEEKRDALGKKGWIICAEVRGVDGDDCPEANEL